MPNVMMAKIGVLAILLAASFLGGWHVKSWKDSHDQLVAEQAGNKAFEEATKRGNEVAAKLETAVTAIETKRIVTLKEIHHETEKLVYSECKPTDDGVLDYQRATERAGNTGKPESPVPPASGIKAWLQHGRSSGSGN